MNAKNDERLVRLIRERFHPLTRFCGPLHAGEVSLNGASGSLYLGELSIWLWPHGSGHNGVLSDELVGNVVSPHFLVRALLVSSRNSMDMLVAHVSRIEAADGDTVSLLRYYLENAGATVMDGMAVGKILAPLMGEHTQ